MLSSETSSFVSVANVADQGCDGIGEGTEQQGQRVVVVTLGVSLKHHLVNTGSDCGQNTMENWNLETWTESANHSQTRHMQLRSLPSVGWGAKGPHYRYIKKLLVLCLIYVFLTNIRCYCKRNRKIMWLEGHPRVREWSVWREGLYETPYNTWYWDKDSFIIYTSLLLPDNPPHLTFCILALAGYNLTGCLNGWKHYWSIKEEKKR